MSSSSSFKLFENNDDGDYQPLVPRPGFDGDGLQIAVVNRTPQGVIDNWNRVDSDSSDSESDIDIDDDQTQTHDSDYESDTDPALLSDSQVLRYSEALDAQDAFSVHFVQVIKSFRQGPSILCWVLLNLYYVTPFAYVDSFGDITTPHFICNASQFVDTFFSLCGLTNKTFKYNFFESCGVLCYFNDCSSLFLQPAFTSDDPMLVSPQIRMRDDYFDILAQLLDSLLLNNATGVPSTLGGWHSLFQISIHIRPSDEPLICFKLKLDKPTIETNEQPALGGLSLNILTLNPQGEDDLDPTTTSESGNTVNVDSTILTDLTDNRGSNSAQPTTVDSTPQVLEAFSQPPTEFPFLTSIWINLRTFLWTVAESSGSIIQEFNLPYDLLSVITNNPAFLPYYNFEYFRPQLTLEFQPNATRFHSGMLIIGIKYYSTTDGAHPGSRIPTRSEQLFQLDYATIRASSSNPVILKIPFQSYMEMVPIRDSVIGSNQYYCSVYVGVVSPLGVGEGGTTNVSINCQIKLECDSEHTKFFGRISRKDVVTVNPQGVGEIIGAVSSGVSFISGVIKPVESILSGLGKVFSSSNQDKPVDPREASPVLLWPTVSLSHGDGPTHSRPLRVNPSIVNCFHPSTVPVSGDSLNWSSFFYKWGYYTSFKVSSHAQANSHIGEIEISPMLSAKVPDGILPTPLAGVAGSFVYWQGSLEFKFILVKADPHSVRLRFSTSASSSTPADRQNDLPSEVVDFQELTEYTIVTPYFGPTRLTQTTRNGDAICLGSVSIRYEGIMANIPTCASEIDLIVLVRAHPTFELSVPCQQFFRPSVTSNTRPLEYVIEYFEEFPGKPQNQQVWYTVTDTSQPDWYWKGYSKPPSEVTAIKPASFLYRTSFSAQNVILSSNNREQFKNQSLIYLEPNPLIIVENLEPIATNLQLYNATTVTPSLLVNVYKPLPGTVARIIDSRPVIIEEVEVPKDEPIVPEPTTLNPQGDGEEREAPSELQGGKIISNSFSNSELITGEIFNIKSSLRRYQLWHRTSFTFPSDGLFDLSYDVTFGAASLRTAGQRVDNLTFYHDAFRFSKGSLNYLINVTNSSIKMKNLKLQVFHEPGSITDSPIESPMFTLITNDKYDELSFFGKEIAVAGGSQVAFTTPYYNTTNFLVNGYNPDVNGHFTSAAYSAGRIHVIIDAKKDDSLNMEVLRALGDDAGMAVFQGWPVCTNNLRYLQINSSIPFVTPQGEEEVWSFRQQNVKPIRQLDVIEEEEEEEEEVQPIRQVEEEEVHLSPPTVSSSVCFMRESQNSKLFRRKFKKYVQKKEKLCRKLGLVIPQDLPEQVPIADSPAVALVLTGLGRAYQEGRNSITIVDVIPPCLEQWRTEIEALSVASDSVFEFRNYVLELVFAIEKKYQNVPNTFWIQTGLSKEVTMGGFMKRFIDVERLNPGSLISNVVHKVNKSMGHLISISKSTFSAFEFILKTVGRCIEDPSVFFRLISDLQIFLYASDAWVKAMSFVNILMSFGILSYQQVGICYLAVEMLFLCRPPKITQLYSVPTLFPQDECDEQKKTVSKWCAAIVGGTAALAGFSAAPNWSKGVEAFAKNAGTVTYAWERLLTGTCTFVTDYVIYLFGLEKPESIALAELKRRNVDVSMWVDRVLELTNPEEHDVVLASPTKRKEVSDLYESGALIIKVLNERKDFPGQTSAFLTVWKRLVDLYGETGEVPNSISANMPPVCIWIYGRPGVGKSVVAAEMAIRLAKLMDITYDGDPVFVRTPRKFWDGYNGQPIVLFDDALQVTSPDIMSAFCEDWFGLLTNAPFSPEFSHLSEKKKIITPKLVIVCSNQKFPSPANVVSKEAFNRRRDFLLTARFSKAITDKYSDIVRATDPRLCEADMKDFKHLRFDFTLDPTDEKSKEMGDHTLNEALKVMHTRVEMLVKLRKKAAQERLDQSEALTPERIAEERTKLVDELSSMGTVKSVFSNLVGSAAEVVGPQGEEERESVSYSAALMTQHVALADQALTMSTSFTEPRPHVVDEAFRGEKDEGDICLYGCETLITCKRLRPFCSCGGDEQDDTLVLKYCGFHGTFVARYRKKKIPGSGLSWAGQLGAGPTDSFILGSCTVCSEAKCDHHFNNCIKIVAANNQFACGGVKAILPKPRGLVLPPVPSRITVALDDFKNWLNKQVTSFWRLLPWKYITIIGLSLSLMFIIKAFGIIGKLKEFFVGKEEPSVAKAPSGVNAMLQPVPQMASSGSVSVSTKSAPVQYRLAHHQGSTDDLVRRINRNRIKISVYWKEGYVTRTWGLGLYDHTAIFPSHTFQSKPGAWDKLEIRLRGPHGDGGCIELRPTDIQTFPVHGADLWIVKLLNRRIPPFKKILNSLVDKNELHLTSVEGCLVDVLKDSQGEENCLRFLNIKREDSFVKYNFIHREHLVDFVGFTYPYESDGLCGSILIDRRRGCIVGMHVAGLGGKGYSALLCREFFRDVSPQIDVEEPELQSGGSVKPVGAFLPLGKVLDHQCVTLPLKSQIVDSQCVGVLTAPVRKPARMIEPGEAIPGVTRLTCSVEKGGNPTKTWELELIDEVSMHMENKFLSLATPLTVEVRRRTVDEAIVGVRGVPFMEALKRNTSVGWPLSTLKLGTKKTNFIQYREDAEGLHVENLHSELVKLYDASHSARRKGIVPFSVYQNFMKDEPRPLDKVDKPRLINGCPLDQVIEFRRYLLDFAAAVQQRGFDLGLGIGMNVHGPDWSNLARRLLSVGESILCGDYSNFGPGLDPELVLRCGKIANAWYRQNQNVDVECLDEDDRVRDTLFLNLAFSYQISRDTVIQQLCGSPSGNPFTALINSMVNLMYIQLAYLKVFKNTTVGTLSMFDQLVYVAVYGDDVIMSVHDTIIDEFNNVTLFKIFAEVDIKYTDALKSGVIKPYSNLAEATFLKCYFVPHPTRGTGYFLGALEKPVIEDIPNRIRLPSADKQEASLANCVDACRFSYAWGYEYYEATKKKLTDYWRAKGVTFSCESWHYLDQLYFGELRGVALPKGWDPAEYAWC
uniref:Genome polyprotein n=1 Tax=Picornavirales sp. TaxID=1955153 RepID=A0A6M9ZAE6_9VIRU|nr:MAG: hypothetical protein [Picornavirales sp.]